MSIPLYVGIDVSSKDNAVCCLTKDSEKHPVSRFTVQNNRPGIMELRERIVHLTQKHGVTEVMFGLEHTGCYSMQTKGTGTFVAYRKPADNMAPWPTKCPRDHDRTYLLATCSS